MPDIKEALRVFKPLGLIHPMAVGWGLAVQEGGTT